MLPRHDGFDAYKSVTSRETMYADAVIERANNAYFQRHQRLARRAVRGFCRRLAALLRPHNDNAHLSKPEDD